MDEFEPDGWGEGGVRTRSFIDSSTSCIKILAPYRAMDAMAAVSFSAAEAIIANNFRAVVAWVIASPRDSPIPDEASRMDTNNPSKVLFSAALIKVLL